MRCSGRIDDAVRFIFGADLAISPQCGFATHAERGNNLTVDQQRGKLDLTAAVARG
jgi:methionine synthase II (cobalamin-independent)